MVGGVFFRASSSVFWKGLEKGNNYWLYVRATTKTMTNPSAIRAVASRYRLEESPDALLVAEVNLREMEPEVNPYPDGKIYSQDIARHASDKENPHGLRLYQDELVVKHLILRSIDEEATIEVDIDGEARQFSASLLPGAINEIAGRAVEIVDFDSFGPDGGVLQIPSRDKVIHAQVQRRAAGKVDFSQGIVGDIAVGYHGEDERNDEPNEFSIYNSGAEGLPMRAIVYCG
jgi:hypothetical protein